MMKYFAAALVAGTALVPAAASAQDAPFTGLRVEGLAGYDSLRSGQSDNGVDTNDDEGDETVDGAAYGIGVGYDIGVGPVVLGVEGELSESSGEREFNESIDGISYLGRFETGRDLYVGGRVGLAVAPRTLVYGKVGYTNLAVDAGFESDDDVFEADVNLDGYRLGAGVEQVLGRNTFAKLEYRYSNYGELNFEDQPGGADFDRDVDLDRHQVMAGVGFRF